MRVLYADVILPLHVNGTYTYRVPQEYNDSITTGQRVIVQFGRTRLYSAVVRRVHEQAPQYPAKYIQSIVDANPIVSETQCRFWEWMAEYYMCYIGDVMAIALPSSLRINSESHIAIHPEFDGDISTCNPNECKIIETLQIKSTIPVEQVSKIIGFAKTMPLLQGMIERNIIILQEELKQRYTPKTTPYLHLNPKYTDPDEQRALFEQLEHNTANRKQMSVLIKFLQLSHFGRNPIKKKELTACTELSPSAIQTLIKKEVLLPEKHTANRMPIVEAATSPDSITLNSEQQQAYEYLRQMLPPHTPASKPVNLLHGVTGSGKTEVYIKLIAEVVQQGGQVLFLLPEIALTSQIIHRLQYYFGSLVGVYHSHFNSNERADVWHRTMDTSANGYRILLGARSALFLPYHNLQLVIVDEEHDSSYKQNDPAPRYQGRDSAIYLAHLHHACTILGSATPSIESTFNARAGKYGLVQLSHRYGDAQMPDIRCVDMAAATRNNEVSENLSHQLIAAIQEALNRKEQVILFQNRRGFAVHIECAECHWIPTCVNCDVSLVYHKSSNSLRCHYCGHHMSVPTECPVCHSSQLVMKGFGTERIEEDLGILFPTAKIERMDLDSTSQKNRHIEIINAFEEHNIDILVGTQMVTKGLDFDNVSVVGILNADHMLSYPDFRSYERAYQLMTQMAGRSGRHHKQGSVFIQSFHPDHPIIQDALQGNYDNMYSTQINDRRIFRYPPYYRLITITLKHAVPATLNQAAALLSEELRKVFGHRVLGPEYPIVPRIRGQYLKNIHLRFSREEGIYEGKKNIIQITNNLLKQPEFRSITLRFDVDPQ